MSDPTSPGSGAAYPISVRNRVRRLHERARYDRSAVWAVLDAAMLCHVAYVIDGQPYCTPLSQRTIEALVCEDCLRIVEECAELTDLGRQVLKATATRG